VVCGLSRESDSMSSLLQEGNNDVGGRRRFGLRGGENRREDQDVDCGLNCKHRYKDNDQKVKEQRYYF
jgi:hypothetical protein